ncbi:cytosolic factor, phosphatidylinositol/phosphatidylcholine transfer protein [Blyttiomyces sp. JEL0837]|nr:cytosolic factor, phosphatidylinositol/phosphatidylcholine transfer protein [Blyttiomyces sp. JEL0837]
MSLYNSMENLQGRLGHLTQEQEEILADFKRELASENLYDPSKHDDHLLLRFLRARKFQIPLAKKMWTECEQWREDYQTDTIITTLDFPEYPIVKKFYPRFYHKTDKIGRPVYVEMLGVLDIKQLFAVTTDERMLRNHVYEYEKLVHYRLPACGIKAGRHLEQSLVIMDLKGVSLSQFASVYGLVKQVSTIAQNYYPEMLGKMYIINAPMLFTGVWSLVKPLLDEVTVNKINILGSNYKEKLLESIDAENLPSIYGGTCTCSSTPGGCELSDVGPWNDGSVPNYPKKEFERMQILYGDGDFDRHVKK